MSENRSPSELATLSTISLLDEARAGNQNAIDVLYERHMRRLKQWARGRLPSSARDAMDTEDLVQDALMKTLHHLESFDPQHSGAFQAYLKRSVLNLIKDQHRRIQRRPPAEETASRLADHRPSQLEEAIGQDTLERYEAAMEQLEPADRELIVARIELGLTYEMIALESGKNSADAARMAVSRSLSRLAEKMRSLPRGRT